MGQEFQFSDGQGYENMMGVWSAQVGSVFLDWLGIPPGRQWIDVGCGNGASTELICTLGNPASIESIDPSEAQLAFARQRHTANIAKFTTGSAVQLPYADDSADVAMMALVLFFVPDPARGVAEMVRVVRPGGTVAAYVWDIIGGGFPYEATQVAMQAVGAPAMIPPRSDIATPGALEALWRQAGLADVATRTIDAERIFPDFETYWTTATSAPGIRPALSTLGPDQLSQVKEMVRKSFPAGELAVGARAFAVKGRVPA